MINFVKTTKIATLFSALVVAVTLFFSIKNFSFLMEKSAGYFRWQINLVHFLVTFVPILIVLIATLLIANRLFNTGKKKPVVVLLSLIIFLILNFIFFYAAVFLDKQLSYPLSGGFANLNSIGYVLLSAVALIFILVDVIRAKTGSENAN